MKVLFILPETRLAGTEQATLRFIIGLKQNFGVESHVFSLNPFRELKPILDQHEIPSFDHLYKGPAGILTYRSLKRSLQALHSKHHYDAIILTVHNFLCTQILSNLKDCVRVLNVHFHHEGVYSPVVWKLHYAYSFRVFDKITFASDFIRHEAEKIADDDDEKYVTLRNPLPVVIKPSSKERSNIRQSLGISDEEIILGNCGQLIERKRFDVFINVLARLTITYPKITFKAIIAGDGEKKRELIELAEELGVNNKIVWLGWQKDMQRFYSSIDVLLFNTDWDAFPTTPLEAMNYEIPVVASAIHSGLGEAIEHGVNGYLIREHDVEKLSSFVYEAVTNKENKLKLSARETVQRICSFNSNVQQLKSILTIR
jgi:glycosyltransferase involved in cell wall biosynthesis